MDQLHRRLKDEQIKVLFRAYCQGHLPRDAVQKTLGIGKTRFFALLREYRHDPETFSVCYTRATPSRVTPAVEQEIQRQPLREREIVEDRRLPICGYNYSALRDRLAKRGIKVSVTTIIDRARRLDCYNPRRKGKAHDRVVLTAAIGALIQHGGSTHLWSPLLQEKWTLITSIARPNDQQASRAKHLDVAGRSHSRDGHAPIGSYRRAEVAVPDCSQSSSTPCRLSSLCTVSTSTDRGWTPC